MQDLSDERITQAFRSFLRSFAAPPLPAEDGEHLICGFSNDLGLPADGEDFVVFTPLTCERQGATIEDFDPATEATVLRTYYVCTAQVDCYSADRYSAQARASAYETAARSSYGVELFKRYGLDLHFAGGLANRTAVMDSDQYVSRWSLTFTFGFKKALQVDQPAFDAVACRVVNVDVNFH